MSTALRPLTGSEYRTLVEQAPILIWRSDTTMACDYFNERWLEFTGRTLEQERGNGWAEGVHPDDMQRCLAIYQDAFAARRIFEMEYRLRRHDGVYRWLFDRGVPFHSDSGAFEGYIGSCVDVHDRVEAQDALRRAQEAEVRQLQSLLPICVSCKQIRDVKGYWNQLEGYLARHKGLKFTHGLCPKCANELYPDC